MNTAPIGIGLIAAVILSTVTSPASAVANYGFIDLGRFVPGHSDANGINNAGQVAGNHTSLDSTGGDRATLWENVNTWGGTTATELGLLDGPSNSAYGINNAGQVTGSADMPYFGIFVRHATVWNGTKATDLGAVSPYFSSVGHAINNAGHVAGFSGPDATYAQGFVWNDHLATGRDSLMVGALRNTYASAINMANQVVGFDELGGDTFTRAILWNGVEATLLPTLGGTGSAAYDINDVGEIVGFANLPNGGYHEGEPSHAALWHDGIATDLGTLGGISSQANAINESGQIVGSFNYRLNGNPFGGVTHAALWDGTTAVDLNNLLQVGIKDAGWVLTDARDINDNGWIVGQAHNDLTGAYHAFLLIPPVPEPETYALFIAGLGLMGLLARRRKNS